MTEMQFKVNGVQDVVRVLKELNSVSATKVGTSSLREGAKIVRDEFAAAAPFGTEPTRKSYRTKRGSVDYDYGHLRDNITIKKLKAERQHQIKYGVGVGAAFWGLFLEKGTSRMPAKPWMRQAWDVAAPRVLTELGRLLGRGIDREAKRLRRRARKLGL